MAKIWAICSGGDWNDASVAHLILPDEMDIEKERKEHKQKLRECHRLKTQESWPGYFVEYLISKGAVVPTDNQLEEYWED